MPATDFISFFLALERDARDFARRVGLDPDLIIKGARIAKDPQYFTTIPGVTEEEKRALQGEKRHRFRQPSALYLTILVCSIGAAVQGWDQTGSNGANLNWPEAFRLNTDQNSNDFWILGLVNESPRWYIKKRRFPDAFNSLVRLRNTEVQAARDLYYIQAQVRLEEEALGGGDIITSDGQERPSASGGYFSRFMQLFMYPRIRRATLAAFVVMIAQQMCGSMSPRPHKPWRKSASAAKSPS
ncbi:MAG: hypothetical protein Q9193_003093 [Seirophora villosa]